MSFLKTTCRTITSFLFQNSLSSRLLLNRAVMQPFVEQTSNMSTVNQMHRNKFKKEKTQKRPTFGVPFLRGIVLKTLIKKPKKPNSANRKCVRVRLSNGKEATAYVPGEGHNLQEHSIVLLRGGRLQDVPGVKLKCVRGKYDLAHVKK